MSGTFEWKCKRCGLDIQGAAIGLNNEGPLHPGCVNREQPVRSVLPKKEGAGVETIWDKVIEDMKTRQAVGLARYGKWLMAHNGRDALQDAYEEALDLAVYLRQAIEERDNPSRGEP